MGGCGDPGGAVSAAADRAMAAITFWGRQGDPGTALELLRALDADTQDEVRETYGLVVETLFELPGNELQRLMYEMAAKSRGKRMNEPRYEPTTILSGGHGAPTVVVRDHDGWRAQVEAEKRRQQDEETKALLERIEHARAVRESTPRRALTPVEEVYEDHAREKWLAEAEEKRRWTPQFVEEQLATEELLLEAMMAGAPPPPDPADEARQRDNAYSDGLREWKARAAVCGHRSCMPGACVYAR